MSKARKYTITAHTGTMGTAENSLESISAGIKNGADIVEFDLRFNNDGVPVLSHNETKGGEVLFEDALKFVAEMSDTVKMNIDIKQTDDLKTVEELVIEYGLLDRAFFTGIEEEFVPAVKEQCSQITYYLNCNIFPPLIDREKFYAKVAKLIKDSGAIGLNAMFLCLSRDYVEYLHNEGLLVSAWTPNSESKMRFCIDRDVDNITTKYPDILRKL